MPITGHGAARYPHRRPQALPRMSVGGVDLGPAMRPQDVFAALRRILALREPAEVVEIMRLGAQELRDAPQRAVELDDTDRALAIEQAESVTSSRVDAWRRRAREMTWLELRVLLIGLAAIEREEQHAPAD